MKQAEDKPRWFFVDEAGSPAIYGKGKKIIIGAEGCSYTRRGNKAKQHSLRAAVEAGAEKFRKQFKGSTVTKVLVETSQPAQEPALQAVDYVLWAVQRAFEKGEMRYFEYMREKIELLWDLYDIEKIKKGDPKQTTIYDRRRNPFDIKKASPLS